MFDRKVMKKGGATTFEKGQLVQAYQSDLANSLATAQKNEPMWTGPWRVTEWLLNSYNLELLDREPLRGDYNTRRLREFILRKGTELAAEQGIFETTQEELGSREDMGEIEAVGDKREIDVEEEVEINVRKEVEINVGKEVEITSITGNRDVA